MTILEDTDFQEKERKTYSPEYQFGQHWMPVQNISYDQQATKGVASNPYLSDGGYITSLPELAIGGILWLDNGRSFFTDLRKGRISSLRLRVRAGLPTCAIGAFWIPREERLLIHDMYKMGGKNLWKSMKFSERWGEIEAVAAAISQDVGFQGFTLDLMNPVSFGEGEGAGAAMGPIIWIQPEKAGARALRIHSIPGATTTVAATATATINTSTSQKVVGAVAVLAPAATTYNELLIGKDPVRMGPEAYCLYTEDGKDAGQPAIQKMIVSQAIRSALASQPRVKVNVRWNVSFGRYEVLGVK